VPDPDSSPTLTVINGLLASGFPFQTAITEVVKKVPYYRVAAEEFPWRDEAGADRFLDLIVHTHSFIVTIECKKTQKEIFTFLQPNLNSESVNRARCFFLHQIDDSSKRLELWCCDWDFRPKSLESQFCVVTTSESRKDQRLLEKDAQLLVGGTEAYGRSLTRERKTELGEPDRYILPVIVTNAKLFSATYDPNDVSLDTGQLPFTPSPAISTVEWVRFRKAFTAGNQDLGDRTVFVVAATSLERFLQNLDSINPSQTPRHPVLA
jgi:hypothetical protein